LGTRRVSIEHCLNQVFKYLHWREEMNTIMKAALVATGLAFGGVASAAAIPKEGLFFSAYDVTNGTSIVINLGTTTTAFRNTGASSPFTLSGDGLGDLQTWLSTADVSAVWWNVVGAADDGSGVTTPTENYGGLATSTNIATVPQSWGSFQGLDTTVSNINTFRSIVNPGLATSDGFAPPASDIAAYFVQQDGGAAFESRAGVGEAMPFYAFFADANDTFFSGDYSALGGDWLLSFANNTASLSYSPIPLPAAAWLLLSGIAGLVGVARRKTAA
jgi:hypothetical protein